MLIQDDESYNNVFKRIIDIVMPRIIQHLNKKNT